MLLAGMHGSGKATMQRGHKKVLSLVWEERGSVARGWITWSRRSGCWVKGHLPCSASTAFQVARPITWPYGEMAGVTTGSRVIGSMTLGQGLSSS